MILRFPSRPPAVKQAIADTAVKIQEIEERVYIVREEFIKQPHPRLVKELLRLEREMERLLGQLTQIAEAK